MRRNSGSPVAMAAWRRRAQQLAVVVQHFLEVRNHPVLIDGVAREAAAELVVDAAFGHARQRQRRHVQRMQIGLVAAGARAPLAQQKVDVGRMRKLRRAAEAAKLRSKSRASCSRAVASGAERQRVSPEAAGGAARSNASCSACALLAMSVARVR